MANGAVNDSLTAVVFSKDRPLQLHAAVASMRATCTDPERLRVRAVVHASSDEMGARYRQVAAELPFLDLVPEAGFRATTLEVMRGARWLGFVVDDALFVRPWSVDAAVQALQHIPLALGVSLRLGRNTTSCYTLRQPQAVPATLAAGPWLAYEWTRAEADFGYPLELSSSVYRAEDLAPLLESLAFRNPNELEAALAQRAGQFRESRPVLLMAEKSLAFCAPVNVVQTTFQNRAGERPEYGVEALAALFDRGGRVDVAALRGFTPSACHEEIELPLVGGAAPQAKVSSAPPAVSVVIPCYRQAEYLAMAISSVALQRFKDLEIIVVNDGSPDDTSAVVRRLAAQLPGVRLRLLEQENAGLANARNAGIRAARGRYVLPLDSDDALDPDHLARTVAVLEADPSIAIVATDAGVFGARSGVWRTGRPFDVVHLLEENGLAYCSLYRREVWERTGGYRANMSAGYEDWDFWVGAAEAGFRAAHLPEPLFLYREKAESMLGDARRHHPALRAQLLQNHPALVDAAARAEAARVLAELPLPAAKPATEGREVPLDGAAPALAPRAMVGLARPVPYTGPGAGRAAARPDGAAASAGQPVASAPATVSPRPATGRAEARLTLPSAPKDPAETLRVLAASGAWKPGLPLRLHLGCGERRVEGYVNVDLPPAAASIMATRADVFGDVPELRFPPGTVDELRSHHVFEHFPRVEALALLIRWHEWLRPGGKVVIETPDLEGSARTLVSDQSLDVKMGVVRHLAGDQAEGWAFHVDHWFPARFRRTFEELGFGEVQVQQTSWSRPPYLSNVIAAAVKGQDLTREDLLARADRLLGQSLVAAEEQAVLERWRAQLRTRLAGGPVFRASAGEARAKPGPETPVVVAPPAPGPSAWIEARGSREPLAEIVDFNQRARDRWVAGRAGSLPRGARVLDVGAGTCPYRPRFAHCEYVTHDFKAYEGEKLGGGSDYGRIDLVSDITAIPAPDASFDVVLCTEVLEHVPEPAAALGEMARLLRPGGRLLVTAPLGSGLHQLPFHYFGGFSPAFYREVAARCGLTVESITPNGGFFRLMAQEAARAASLLGAGPPAERPPPEVLRLLGDLLPRWFFALDDARFVEQFTVGYFVELRRAAGSAR